MSEVYADALDWRRKQVEEYSQYVADGEIRNATGTVVYPAGAPIPADNVESDGSVILLRHPCPGVDPLTGRECSIPHNAVIEKTEPGRGVKVKRSASAKKEESK